MADSYQINGVTITPQGGGYYDLTHPSLAEPIRERGKEQAEAKAEEIANTLRPEEGRMEPQTELPTPAPAPAPAPEATTGGEATFIPDNIPREYAGQMDPKRKAALEAQGIAVETVILEDNPDIPPTGLFISHNGRGYMLMPGEVVDVPKFVLDVLRHAIMSAPIVDNKTRRVVGYRDRMRYPFRPA